MQVKINSGSSAPTGFSGVGCRIQSVRTRLAAFARTLVLGSDRGGAVVELALLMPLLSMVLFGIIDFGTIYVNDQQIINTVASATRYATRNSANGFFSNSATAPFNTIQGQLQLATSPSGTILIPNDDSHIRITYLSDATTECGHYVQSTNTAPSSCYINGYLLRIQVTYTFASLTPLGGLFPGGSLTLPISTTMVVGQ